ncbi:MAG: hypothetical protein LIO46_07470, partial [Clostridiales bacterium]|nr:hypothetical protein [Clostridiales bacterium]
RGFWQVPELPPLRGGMVQPEPDAGTNWCQVHDLEVQTPAYRIQFEADGSIASLYDRELEREWTDGAFNQLALYHDNPGVYDAWDILPGYQERRIALEVKSPLKLTVQDGEVAEFTVVHAAGQSVWKRIIRLFRRSRAIEVENQVDWQADHKLAKVLFGCNVLTRELACDTSAGIIKRETHKNTSWQEARFEVCHHKWCDLSEQGGGIAILNEGKYGVGADGNTLSLSLLRSTKRPDITSDRGKHCFCYCILPHAGDAVQAGVNRAAYEYNVPLVQAEIDAVPFPVFEGLFLQCVKISEDGTMLVVRLSEQDGKRGKIALGRTMKMLNLLEDIEGETDRLDYKPFELITLGIPLEELQERVSFS